MKVRPLDVTCPQCSATAHASCRSKSGRKTSAHASRCIEAKRQEVVLAADEQRARDIVAIPTTVDVAALDVARDAVLELRFDDAMRVAGDLIAQVAVAVESLRAAAILVAGLPNASLTLDLHRVADVPALVSALKSLGASGAGTTYGELELVRSSGRTYYASTLRIGALQLSIFGNDVDVATVARKQAA